MLKQFLRTLTKFNTTAQFLFITKGHKKQNPRSGYLIHPLGKEIHFSLCLTLDTYLVKENKFKGRQWQSLGRNKSNSVRVKLIQGASLVAQVGKHPLVNVKTRAEP